VATSVLVAIYVPERVSNAARHAVRAVRQILFTQLRELEMRNACELLVGRDLITTDECRAIRAQTGRGLRQSAACASVGIWIKHPRSAAMKRWSRPAIRCRETSPDSQLATASSLP
jgi:hypothetical protein